MAGTFYKYAERNVNAEVNWAEIGREFTDMLSEEMRLREEKKQALQDATKQDLETLNNAPTGDFKTGSDWAINYGDTGANFLLMQNRLLRGGMIKPKDYAIVRQNLKDSTDQLFSVMKEIQKEAADKKARYEADESQDFEPWLMEQIEGLSNFSVTSPYINPVTGVVSLSKMKKVKKKDENGNEAEVMVADDNPNSLMSIQQLRSRMSGKYDKYKYEDQIDASVGKLGEFVTSTVTRVRGGRRMFQIDKIEDPTVRSTLGLTDEEGKAADDYFAWEDNTVGAQLANPWNTMSILTNSLDQEATTGLDYEPTFDPEQAKTSKHFILVEDDGSGVPKPKFTKEQEEAAGQFLRTQIRNAVDRKVSTTIQIEPEATYRPPRTYEESRIKQESFDAGKMIGYLYSGDQAQVDAAKTFFESLPHIRSVDRTATGVIVVDQNGDSITLDFYSGKQKKVFDDWVAMSIPRLLGGTKYDTKDIWEGVKQGRLGRELNTTATSASGAKKFNVVTEFDAFMTDALNPALQATGEEELVDILTPIIATIPGLSDYKVDYSWDGKQAIELSRKKRASKNDIPPQPMTISLEENSMEEVIRKIKEIAVKDSRYEDQYKTAKQSFERRTSGEQLGPGSLNNPRGGEPTETQ